MSYFRELSEAAQFRTRAVDRDSFAEAALDSWVLTLEDLGAGAVCDCRDSCNTACHEGCSFCCHMRVVATVPEVLAIANEIRLHWDRREISTLTDRIEILNSKSHGQSDEEWGIRRYRCPLLVDGICSVYNTRPLDCRAYNSQSVSACRDAWKSYLEWDVPVNQHVLAIYKNLQAGVLNGLVSMGRSSRLVELTAALNIALKVEQVVEKWRDGEPIFEEAEIDPLDPEQLAFTDIEGSKVEWVPSDSFRD